MTSAQEYFEQHGVDWGGYQRDGYSVPTSVARNIRTVAILANEFPNNDASVVDLGCGGGHLCQDLVRLGYKATGVDFADSMVAAFEKAFNELTEEERGLLRLVQSDVLDNGLAASSMDAVTAMGLIGYLEDDKSLFEEAARLLLPSGLFIVSCRNRLFNMTSISHRTLREIDGNNAHQLAVEIMELSTSIPPDDADKFIKQLKHVSSELETTAPEETPTEVLPPTETIEARQQTPNGLRATAESCGFEFVEYYGINPHLLQPFIARSLPLHFYNILSSALEPLAHLPISLAWSSVFLGVFRKSSQ